MPILAVSALAASTDDVRVELGEGTTINWTTLQLEIEATGRSLATLSTEAIEQDARKGIAIAVEQVVGRVQVTSDATVSTLLSDPAIGDAVRARVSRWEVREATYGASGSVSLVAELSLQDALKPWSLQIAAAPTSTAPSEWTGVMVDARGTGAQPAFAPRLIDASGAAVYAGELKPTIAVSEAPFLYVPDPVHPASTRVGDHPLHVTAVEARGSDLVLRADDARAISDAGAVLHAGRIVVVVDAP